MMNDKEMEVVKKIDNLVDGVWDLLFSIDRSGMVNRDVLKGMGYSLVVILSEMKRKIEERR